MSIYCLYQFFAEDIYGEGFGANRYIEVLCCTIQQQLYSQIRPPVIVCVHVKYLFSKHLEQLFGLRIEKNSLTYMTLARRVMDCSMMDDDICMHVQNCQQY